MRVIQALCATVVLVLLGAGVRAEDPAAKAPAPEAATFETVQARPDELPAGAKIVDGLHCVSQAATEFYADPGFAGSLDSPPVRKASQSFQAAGVVTGSVLVFEYAGAVPVFIQRVLGVSLWGNGERSAAHPDEFLVHGKLLFIFSFPYGDAAAEWAKERLRKRFRVPARRTRPERDAIEKQLWDINGRNDNKAGLTAIAASGVAVTDWSIGSYLQGEFAAGTKDWATAETAYRRAVNLHRTLTDPLPDDLAWAAFDGLGNALLSQKKFDEAAKVLAQSKAEGRRLHLVNDETPHTAYVLACALAQLGKWDDALRELTDGVDGNKRWFKMALTEELLADARKRPEFRILLELDPPPPAKLPPKPVAPAKPAEALSFDALAIKPAELPAGWALVDGPQCTSTAAVAFFRTPDPFAIAGRSLGPKAADMGGNVAAPIHKSLQSIVREDGTAGSVITFEYAADVDEGILDFLGGYFWGDDRGPTNRYPEEMLVQGHYLWIFSFPRGDAAGEWVKARLRTRFRIPAHRTRLEMAPAIGRIFAADTKGDSALGLRLLDARAALLADCSFAWYLRGELCVGKQDTAGSEAGYRRALELNDAFVDPLDDHVVWASLDGLGAALLQRKKPDEALTHLARAKVFAAGRHLGDTSSGSYNLACALAQVKRYDESLAELKAAIAAKPSWKDSARDDTDFAEARKRPDFQALLAP